MNNLNIYLGDDSQCPILSQGKNIDTSEVAQSIIKSICFSKTESNNNKNQRVQSLVFNDILGDLGIPLGTTCL